MQEARDAYWEAQVLTASPQKLRLMLIDGALRLAREARTSWDDPAGSLKTAEAISRCRSVLTELACTVRIGEWPVAQQVAAVYFFLLRRLGEAERDQAPDALDDVTRVLELERETWQLVCERLAESTTTEFPVRHGELIPIPSASGVEPDAARRLAAGFSAEA